VVLRICFPDCIESSVTPIENTVALRFYTYIYAYIYIYIYIYIYWRLSDRISYVSAVLSMKHSSNSTYP